MGDSIKGSGSCLCGKVKIKAENIKSSIGACHCNTCRKWGGGPFLAVDCGADVSFDGKDNIGVFESSEWAERGFCSTCGTHLFYKLKDREMYIVPVGIFADDSPFVFDHQIFIEEKANYYCFENKTKMMTGEEVFAAFAECEPAQKQ
jgi:hypothetical protein